MKKQFFYLTSVVIIMAITLLSSCKKDEIKLVTENPFIALFGDNLLSDTALDNSRVNIGYFEFGFQFSVTKTGKVTQLGVKIPDSDEVRATLWDLSDTSIIVQTNINAVANTIKFVNLATPVELSNSKKYYLTMHADDWYQRERTAEIDYPYPITKGNIKIEKYGWVSVTELSDAMFPQSFENDYIAGLVDITYETEE